MSDQPPLDCGSALGWLEGDARMLEKLKILFIRNVPPQLEGLGASLDSGDIATAERLAHTIVGSTAMIGAKSMSARAGEVERSAMAGDLAGAKAGHEALKEEFNRVMSALGAGGEAK